MKILDIRYNDFSFEERNEVTGGATYTEDVLSALEHLAEEGVTDTESAINNIIKTFL